MKISFRGLSIVLAAELIISGCKTTQVRDQPNFVGAQASHQSSNSITGNRRPSSTGADLVLLYRELKGDPSETSAFFQELNKNEKLTENYGEVSAKNIDHLSEEDQAYAVKWLSKNSLYFQRTFESNSVFIWALDDAEETMTKIGKSYEPHIIGKYKSGTSFTTDDYEVHVSPVSVGAQTKPAITNQLKKITGDNTLQTLRLDSGLEISGKISKVLSKEDDALPIYLQFEGPTQLSIAGKEIEGQGPKFHSQGFGAPVGPLNGATKRMMELDPSELKQIGLIVDAKAILNFVSGVQVEGVVTQVTRGSSGKIVLISFKDCTVTGNGTVLFDPSWGTYDMAVGNSIDQVKAGVADHAAYLKALE